MFRSGTQKTSSQRRTFQRVLRVESLQSRELMAADVVPAIDGADELNAAQNEAAVVGEAAITGDAASQSSSQNAMQQIMLTIPLADVLDEDQQEGGADEAGITDLIDIIFGELDEDGDGETDSSGLVVQGDALIDSLTDGGLIDSATAAASLFPHLSIPVNGVLGYDDAELQIWYRLPGSSTVHEMDINFVTGKEFVDAIEDLDEKGAIVTHISVLGHGGNNATSRGTSITLNDGVLSVGRVTTYDRVTKIITHNLDRIRVGFDGVQHDLTDEFEGFVERNPDLEITLRCCYGGENDDKLGKKINDVLDCTVHAFTDKLKFVPLWNVTMGWLSPGNWVQYD